MARFEIITINWSQSQKSSYDYKPLGWAGKRRKIYLVKYLSCIKIISGENYKGI